MNEQKITMIGTTRIGTTVAEVVQKFDTMDAARAARIQWEAEGMTDIHIKVAAK